MRYIKIVKIMISSCDGCRCGIIRSDILMGCHKSISYGDVFDVMDDSDHNMNYKRGVLRLP